MDIMTVGQLKEMLDDYGDHLLAIMDVDNERFTIAKVEMGSFDGSVSMILIADDLSG